MEGPVADVDTWAQPKMDVNRAVLLIKMKNDLDARLPNLASQQDSSARDKQAFDIAILTYMRLLSRIGDIPSEVRKAAEGNIKREVAYASQSTTFKVEAPNPEEIDFEELQTVFDQYLAADSDAAIVPLNDWHGRAVNWINNYQKSSRNGQRVKAVRDLIGWAEEQMKSQAKAKAGQIYVNAVLGRKGARPLDMVTTDSVKGVDENIAGKGEQGGLSEAHRAAIRLFTGDDFSYVNAATAVDEKRLKRAQQAGKDDYKGKFYPDSRQSKAEKEWREKAAKTGDVPPAPMSEKQRTDKYMEEGALTAGMMAEAMEILKPYKGTVYRGFGIDKAELESIKTTQEYVFKNHTSTSKDPAQAQNFRPNKDKPIAVFATIVNHGGRDISEYSKFKVEAEIVIPADTRFTVSGTTGDGMIRPKEVAGQPGVVDKNDFGGESYDLTFTGPLS
jgi:hypothetical protein